MLFARRLKPSRKETERRTCYGTKAVLDARMVYQPGTQIPEGARLVHLKKGLIFNAIEEEATTTTEVVLAAEVGSMTTTTDAMIVVVEEILEAEAEAAMAVRVSTAENLDTYRETAHNRDKEVGEEVEIESILKTEEVREVVEEGDTVDEEVGVVDEANDDSQTKTERRGEISKTTSMREIDGCDAFDRFPHIHVYTIIQTNDTNLNSLIHSHLLFTHSSHASPRENLTRTKFVCSGASVFTSPRRNRNGI